MKKFLAVLLAVAMMLSSIPMMASAATVAHWQVSGLDGTQTRAKAYLSGVNSGDIISFFVKFATSNGGEESVDMYVRKSSDRAIYFGGSYDANGTYTGKAVYSGNAIMTYGVPCADGWYYIECMAMTTATHDFFVDGDDTYFITSAEFADIRINGTAIDASQITGVEAAESIDAPEIQGEIPAFPEPPAAAATINSASISASESLAFNFYPEFDYVDDIEDTSAEFVLADNSVVTAPLTYEIVGDTSDDNKFARVTKYQNITEPASDYDDAITVFSVGISLVPGETISFDYKPVNDGIGTDSDSIEIRPTISGSAKKAWQLKFGYGKGISLSTDATLDLGYLPTDYTNVDLGNGWYRVSFTVGAATTTGTSEGETATGNDSNNVWMRIYGADAGKVDYAIDNFTVGNSVCTFSDDSSIASGAPAEKPNYTFNYDNGGTFTMNRKEGKFWGITIEGNFTSTPVFTLAGITPQMINDQITCNVMYNNEIIGTKTASVADYLNALKTAEPDYAELADALLVYGGAAQVYTKYNTDNLAAEFTAASIASPAGPYVSNGSEDYKVKSAALHYSDTVSVVFKLVLADTSDVVVYVNGLAVEPELVSGNVYKVSTAPIMFSGLLNGQTVEIEVGGQTISSATYYGVDSAAFKFGNDNDAYGHLVNALYNVAKIAAAL